MNFKKSLGQNLLIDKNISKKILSLTSLKNKQVIEIGAGTGNLTKEILKLIPKEIICIEKDKVFVKKLKTIFQNEKNLIVMSGDILNLSLKIISKDAIILGNLPYNISAQILIKFLNLMYKV